ncbi:hypothetical protein EN851_07595 [Mesorhizobium sp. M8A.F.Ca.ET.208.01.1.1]|uniref:hypothetical protein n=1 Tax=unclassified Mesorhizobium TaxID=325217 RepID=UPI001093ED37|nr:MULTISPECIES: hypothetical protein [unclassified Mesorhizobium]TGQ95377.1 hypothetical protein EN851_07595 [Mesorhizobium sp. M8A.F.Ca.ET.208.01.1.1]TGT55868.1 hypothetical protein EN810_07595 [Mesorhizobium sp. M8A.F.Ca.ET.167.01.1.1]
MTRDEALLALEEANAAMCAAAMLFASIEPTLARFMQESRNMESIGALIHPTLWKDPERQATEALLKPLYQAALDFSKLYKAQLAQAAGALEKVRG